MDTEEEGMDKLGDGSWAVPLPQRGGQVFAPASSAAWLHQAFLDKDPRIERWDIYALGFKMLADLGIEHGITNMVVYPVVYCYRQHLELGLKHIAQLVQRYEGNRSPTPPKGHNLVTLWEAVRPKLESIFSDEPTLRADLDTVEAQIHQFDSVDRIGDAFRYPVHIDNSDSLPGLESLDLRNCQLVVGGISTLFTGIIDGLMQQHDWKDEASEDY